MAEKPNKCVRTRNRSPAVGGPRSTADRKALIPTVGDVQQLKTTTTTTTTTTTGVGLAISEQQEESRAQRGGTRRTRDRQNTK